MGWSQGYRPKRKGEGWYNTMPVTLTRNREYDDAGNGPGRTRRLDPGKSGASTSAQHSDMVGGAAIDSRDGFSAPLPKR